MSNTAYQFNNPTDTISLSPGTSLNGAAALTIALWYKLAPGTIVGLNPSDNYNLISQWGASVPDTTFALYSPAGSLNLTLILNNAVALAEVPLTSALIDDGAFHSLVVQFAEPNIYQFWVDGSSITPSTGGSPIITLSNSAQPVVIGYLSTVGAPFPGMIIAGRPAIFAAYHFAGGASPVLTAGDIANLAAGYPPDVVEWQFAPPSAATNEIGPLEIFAFDGTSPLTGQLGQITATVSGANAVTGVSQFPPFLYTVSSTRSKAHIPGGLPVTIQWANARLADSSGVPLTFTDSDPTDDSWSPATLAGGSSSTASSTLTVSGGSAGSRTLTVSNSSNLLSATFNYTVGPSVIQFATGFPRFESRGANATTGSGTGALLFGRLQKTNGDPVAISAVDLTAGGTVTVVGTYGTRVLPLDSLGSVAFDGITGDFWCPLARQSAILIDDGASGWSTTGTGWTQTSYSTPGTVTSDALNKVNAVYSQVSYTNDASATATYTFSSLPYCGASPFGNQWQVEVILRDNSTGQYSGATTGGPYCPGTAVLSGGSPTTDARYVLNGGSGTQTVDVDQTANGTAQLPTGSIYGNRFFDGSGVYRTTLVGTPVTVNATGTLTVTVSNHAGSGYLVVDAVVARFVPLLLQPGDTVTPDFPDSMFACSIAGTTSMGSSDNTYNAGTPLDTTPPLSGSAQAGSDSWLMPFNQHQARTVKIGFNGTQPANNNPAQYWANRLRLSNAVPDNYWAPGPGSSSSDLTIDQYGRLTALGSGKKAQVNLTAFGTNGVDNCGLQILPSVAGTYTLNLKWTNSSGINFTIGLYDAAVNNVPVLGTPQTFTSGTTGSLTFTYPQPINTPDVVLRITSNTTGSGSVPQNLWVGDGNTPTSTTTESHPLTLALWQTAQGAPQRWMDTFPIYPHFGAQPLDYTPDGGAAVEAVNYGNYNLESIAVTEFFPIDQNRGTDSDGILATFFPSSNPNNMAAGGAAIFSVFKLQYPSGGSYDVKVGQRVFFSAANSTDIANLTRFETNGQLGGSGGTSGIGISLLATGDEIRCFKVNYGSGGSPTTAYFYGGGNDEYATAGLPVTITGPYTPLGTVNFNSYNTGQPSFETTVRLTQEAGNAQWVNFTAGEMLDAGPVGSSATGIKYKIDYICNNTPSGTPIYCEFGNEPWDLQSNNRTGALSIFFYTGLVSHAGIDVNTAYGYWAAYCLYAAKQRCITHGRGGDFIPVVNTNGSGFGGQISGLAAGATAAGFTPTTVFPNLAIGVGGYVTNDTVVNPHFNGGSYKYGPMGQANYPSNTNIPAANAYDWLDDEGRVSLYGWHLLQRGAPADLAAVVSSGGSSLVGSAVTAGYTNAKAVGYEVGYNSFGGSLYTNLGVPFLASTHLSASILPRAYTLMIAGYQGYYEPVYPGGVILIYTDLGVDDIADAAGWQTDTWPGQPAGNGTLAGISTTNPGLYGNGPTKSQIAGALAYYNTPPPFNPSLVTSTTTLGVGIY